MMFVQERHLLIEVLKEYMYVSIWIKVILELVAGVLSIIGLRLLIIILLRQWKVVHIRLPEESIIV